jgi:SAM-dependent methyltransferase
MAFITKTDAKSLPSNLRPKFGLSQRGRAGLEILGAMQKFTSSKYREEARKRFESSPEGRAITREHADDRGGSGVRERVGKARQVAESDPAYRLERFVQRYVAEENFNRGIVAVEEKRPEFTEFLSTPVPDVGGSLELKDGIDGPDYYKKVNWHLEPGGWDGYDLYGPVLAYGIAPLVFRHGGYAAVGVDEDILEHRAKTVRQFPKSHYDRIFEPGCGSGSTLFAVHAAFPDAELVGCDLSPSLLKMGDFVARNRGIPIDFKQRDLRDTGEPDESFDGVITYALHHELSPADNIALFAEMYRILKPGGDIVIMDPPPFREVSAFHAVVLDWDTKHREEPFFTTSCLADWGAELKKAGFTNIESYALGKDSYPWIIRASKG